MASITFELVLGDDQEVYDNLRAALPAGENNLARGLIVPAHPNNQPQTFKISNVTPGISYIVDFTGEWQAPTTPRMYIVPIGTTHAITVALPYGPVTVSIREASGQGDPKTFLLSVVHYATLFRSYAYEITQFSKLPLKQLEDSINTPLSFRLATPLLVGLTNLIPADLETLAALAYKLLVKNLLHTPGTLGATTEILAAFSASNPIFFKMQNINKFDSPLFRSEEVFQGYEAHVWLPNNEVERWQAFIHLLNNLPQLYTLKQITEGEVYVQQGGKMRRHLFDFDSPLANSITTGLSYLTDCFLRLFTCTVTVEAEHYLAFCQATYILDQVIANALSPTDADPLGIAPWNTFSLSGRFDQQFDINSIHDWVYDTPLVGAADGVNRYFRLTKFPISTQAVKIFVDGLLKRLYIDYRISLSGSIISNGYRLLSMPYGSLLVQIDLGEPRPFAGPVFSSLEVRGGAPLQMLLTGVEQSLANVSFVISHPPNTAVGDPQAISIHFVTPKLPNSGNPGENQYGQIAMTAGVSSYALTFTQPTLTIDYQLFISLTVNPMPGGDPAQVQQVFHIVRERNNTGAMIEFSAPLAVDVTLNWWVIEDDSLTLERGTLLLSDGMSTVPLVFTNGPYFDQVVLIVQLWEINPVFIDAAQYLVSAMTIGPGGTNIRFSAPIVGNNYRLDYALFPARDGDFVEFYEPPFGLIEAHYDIKWSRWINAGISPAPDGIRTIFTLPYPCSNPESVYLALDGRLLTQGANNQYTVEHDTVTFTFPPTYEQSPWVVYPVNDPPGYPLPSSWDQGFLNYLPTTGGEYATGWIKASGAITLGNTLSVDGLSFEAVETATGLLVNSSIINVGSYVKFSTLDVTLTGVADATLPRGTITNVGTIALSSTVTWQTLGVTLMGVASSPANENEFTVGVSQDADATSLQTAINSHSILSLTYTASLVVISVPILGVTVSGSPIVMGVLPSTTDLVSGMRVTGTNIPANTLILSVDSPTQITLDKNATGSATVTLLAESLTGSGITLIRSNISNSFEVITVSGALTATNVAVNENYFTVGVGRDEDTSSLIAAINAHSVLNLYYVASGGAGFTVLKAKDIGGGSYNEALIDFGFNSKTNITGDTAPSSYNSYTLYLGEHVVSVPALAVDILANTLYRQFHPYYEGLGVRAITTGTLPSPLALATTYYVVNPTATTFQLSLTPYGTPIDLTSTGSGYHTFTSREVEVEAATFAFQTTMTSVTGNAVISSPVITSITPSTVDLVVGMAVTGVNIPANTIIKSIDSLNQLTLTNKATGSASVALLFENIFRNNEPVRFTTKGVLPAGLNAGQIYYAINITQNRFQVSESIDGSPVAFTDGGTGEFVVYSVPRFAAGLNQTLDLMSLTTEIQKHPITGAKVTTAVVDGLITVTAKNAGVLGNYPLTVTGNSLTVLGLSSGKDSTTTTYATSNLCYYYDAPVTTLDGLSTRLWKQYGGDEFVFTYPPTLQQEGYYISEIYPIDNHPLDSTVANLPCNYPKGLFTQGFGTHFNETGVLVDQPGELVIATANLPVQEEPNGIINGINTIFTITFTSCAGQNSLMLWVDGVFQPSTKYTYTSMGSYGKLTLLTPPAVGQSLWVWYLPYGTACFDERVNALTGTIDGTNQTFSVPDSPWADAPALLVYLEGLFILQTQDYSVINSNTQIQFSGTLAPAVGQSLWAHYNLGSVIPVDNWRQLYVATTDGLVDTFMIPHLLTSELPTSVDSVLVFLDGVNQGGKFVVEVDGFGNPTGNIIFTGGIPEANRRLEVAYIR